ncbi:MAG TPA: hypothetical protein VMA36_09310 [Candidatus Limnocylindria bacterium]|jgi:hypothetical protein|nr:hypothetical protein [Candidatus Limnocylindria bacterium]
MELLIAMIAFFALVVSWFVLPSETRAVAGKPASDAVPSPA